jgi:hypothetical protein
MLKKYIVDIDCFTKSENMTAESVYILGLMWADGTIGSGNLNYSISITGVSEDLDKNDWIFKKTGNWGKHIRKANGNRKQQTTYGISDKEFYRKLYDFDYKFKSKNSAVKILSVIPIELRRYWWLGYFDGDGCIYTDKNNQLFFTSSIDQDWSFFNILPLEINWKHIVKKRESGNYSRMLIQGKDDITNFCNYIYSTIENDNIGYYRKYEKFKKILEIKERKVINLGGVYFNKQNKKWIARMTYNKVQYALGSHLMKEDAINAIAEKRKQLTEIFNQNRQN